MARYSRLLSLAFGGLELAGFYPWSWSVVRYHERQQDTSSAGEEPRELRRLLSLLPAYATSKKAIAQDDDVMVRLHVMMKHRGPGDHP